MTHSGIPAWDARSNQLSNTMPDPIEDSRPAFEAYASDGGAWPKAVERANHGGYKLMQTHALWSGWREAIKYAFAEEISSRDAEIARLRATIMRLTDASEGATDL